MAYPRNFFRLAVSGKGYGDETWTWTLAMSRFITTQADEDNITSVPPAIVAAVRSFHTTAEISAHALLHTIKFNEIDVNGRYANEFVNTVTINDEPGGGASSKEIAPQVSLAVTLRTDASRGLANHGRFYLPYPTGGMDPATGCFTDTTTANYATAAAGLITALNNAVGGLKVCVASGVRTGAMRGVVSVEVGNRPDIIRSRGRSIPEVRSKKPV